MLATFSIYSVSKQHINSYYLNIKTRLCTSHKYYQQHCIIVRKNNLIILLLMKILAAEMFTLFFWRFLLTNDLFSMLKIQTLTTLIC